MNLEGSWLGAVGLAPNIYFGHLERAWEKRIYLELLTNSRSSKVCIIWFEMSPLVACRIALLARATSCTKGKKKGRGTFVIIITE